MLSGDRQPGLIWGYAVCQPRRGCFAELMTVSLQLRLTSTRFPLDNVAGVYMLLSLGSSLHTTSTQDAELARSTCCRSEVDSATDCFVCFIKYTHIPAEDKGPGAAVSQLQ